MNKEIKRGQEVMFSWGKKWLTGKVVATYPEFHEAVKIERDGMDFIIEPALVRSQGEHQSALETARADQARERYADVVKAWQSGAKTASLMADVLQCGLVKAANRIRAAKRRGLLA